MNVYCPYCGEPLVLDDGGEIANYEADLWYCEACETYFETCPVCDGTQEVEGKGIDDIPFNVDCPECEARGIVEIG